MLRVKERVRARPGLASLVGKTLTGRLFDTAVAELARGLSIHPSVTRESVLELLDAQLTPRLLEATAWRLAANLWLLRDFHPVPPWSRQAIDEPVPVQVLGSAPGRLGDRPAWRFSLLALTGTPATLVLQHAWRNESLRAMAPRVGFSKPWGDRPYSDPRQWHGLRFVVLVERELSDTAPRFRQLSLDESGSRIVPPALLDYNRDLLRMRRRVDFDCPEDMPRDLACHHCPIGEDRCPAAVHPRTYERQICERHGDQGWFDPRDIRGGACVECLQEEAKARHWSKRE